MLKWLRWRSTTRLVAPSPPKGDGPSSSSPSGADPDRRLEHQPGLLRQRHLGQQVVDPFLDRTPRILVRIQPAVAVEVAHASTVDLEFRRFHSHLGPDHTSGAEISRAGPSPYRLHWARRRPAPQSRSAARSPNVRAPRGCGRSCRRAAAAHRRARTFAPGARLSPARLRRACLTGCCPAGVAARSGRWRSP